MAALEIPLADTSLLVPFAVVYANLNYPSVAMLVVVPTDLYAVAITSVPGVTTPSADIATDAGFSCTL